MHFGNYTLMTLIKNIIVVFSEKEIYLKLNLPFSNDDVVIMSSCRLENPPVPYKHFAVDMTTMKNN